MRTKVRLAWLGTALRLEAREYEAGLRPTPNGVVAGFIEITPRYAARPVDFGGNPETWRASRWHPCRRFHPHQQPKEWNKPASDERDLKVPPAR